MINLGLYVHFPWCVKKCPYCDFNSHPLRGELPEAAYLESLLLDLEAQLPALEGRRLGSVFFGGGTPSLFSPASIARVLGRLAPMLTEDVEVTLEANPGTAEHQDLAGYRRAGVNRLSFGAQSFEVEKLKALGRIHDRGAIFRSFSLARAGGFDNINLDLMYGLPGQSRDEALEDLRTAFSLEPEHLSWYQLTLEPKTEFARRPPPALPGDIQLEAMEAAGHRLLADAGYERYEVSAYARGNRRCRHNQVYWTFGDYLGVGAGAHGKLTTADGTIHRRRKASQPRLYQNNPTATETKAIDAGDLPGEFMLNALRLMNGVANERFEAATGLALSTLEPIRGTQIEAGLLREDRLAATPRGYELLDSLIAAYL
ncbi:MAG: radical SAM family heme chaperone HemW [Pseudomonadota bacterium]